MALKMHHGVSYHERRQDKDGQGKAETVKMVKKFSFNNMSDHHLSSRIGNPLALAGGGKSALLN